MAINMEKEKLTICFLGPVESIHMPKWAKYFSDKGHNVHLISYETPYTSIVKSVDLGSIKLHIVKKLFPIQTWPFNTILNLPFSCLKIRKLIKRIKPNIINAHYITSYGSLAALLNFHPLVMTAWGSDILVTPQKFWPSKWAVKYALGKSDLITCDAEHMAEAIAKFGVERSKIKIINFGIDTQKFSPGLGDEELKKELGISGCKTVISLRRLEPIYNVETLISATPPVLKEIPKTKFIILDKGSQEEELKKLSEGLGIREDVKFLGQVPNQELPRYLRIADVYVSTALSDGGIASSTAEAMACGLPAIITDTGDNRKWVKDNENGFVIPTKSPDALAEKIIYLLKDENLCKKMGYENRKIIEERNDYYKEMTKMEEIYLNLVKRK